MMVVHTAARKNYACAIVDEEGWQDIVTILDLETAVTEDIAFFTKNRGLTNACRESCAGGALLYGTWWVAREWDRRQPKGDGASKIPLVVLTDSDLSVDMSLCGHLVAGIFACAGRTPISCGVRKAHLPGAPPGAFVMHAQNKVRPTIPACLQGALTLRFMFSRVHVLQMYACAPAGPFLVIRADMEQFS